MGEKRKATAETLRTDNKLILRPHRTPVNENGLTARQQEVFDAIRALEKEGAVEISVAMIARRTGRCHSLTHHCAGALARMGHINARKSGVKWVYWIKGGEKASARAAHVIDRRPPRFPDGPDTKGRGEVFFEYIDGRRVAVPDYSGEEILKPSGSAGRAPGRACDYGLGISTAFSAMEAA